MLAKVKMGSGEDRRDRTTTSECSEDRTVVLSMMKTDSELYICTQHMSMLHPHIWRTAKLSDQTHKH